MCEIFLYHGTADVSELLCRLHIPTLPLRQGWLCGGAYLTYHGICRTTIGRAIHRNMGWGELGRRSELHEQHEEPAEEGTGQPGSLSYRGMLPSA